MIASPAPRPVAAAFRHSTTTAAARTNRRDVQRCADGAVDAVVESGGFSRAFATSEALRYLSWPAQATCYKLGERRWLDGRVVAMRAQGERFDRKDWHSRALARGPLGLDRLRDELATIAAGSAPGRG